MHSVKSRTIALKRLWMAGCWLCAVLARGQDGDLASLEWGPVSSPKEAGTAFPVTITARDASEIRLSGFNSEAELRGHARGIREIGAGTFPWEFPLYTWFEDARTQVIYLQEEVGEATRLKGLALDVLELPRQSLNLWTIRLKHTELDHYITPSLEGRDSGWTTAYQASMDLPATGWVWFEFSEPFDYNGTDNLMVDFSFNNSRYTSNGLVNVTEAPSRAVVALSDSNHGDPLDWAGTSLPTAYLFGWVPNIRLNAEIDVDISPTQTTAFAQGAWSGWVTVAEAVEGLYVSALHDGIRGDSMTFNVEWDVPLLPPAALWAGETNETRFVAEWTEVPGATSYRLDVATNDAFFGGGPGSRTWTNDFIGIGGGTGSSYLTRTWTNNTDIVWTAYKGRMDQTVNGLPSICLQNASGAYFGSSGIPNGIGELRFTVQQMFSGSGGRLTVYVNGSSAGTVDYNTTVQTAVFANINISNATSLVISNNTSARPAINRLVWTDFGSGGSSFVPGYSNLVVSSGTHQNVEGLADNTTYYFRALAVSNDYVGPHSTTARVTTIEAPRPPAFTSPSDAYPAFVEEEMSFMVSASANPPAVLELAETTASDGYHFSEATGELIYTPPAADEGLQLFTFTASNGLGVATQQVPVAVSPQPPGGGLETFYNFPPSASAYLSGTFPGQDGSTWTYVQARGDLSITGKSPTLNRGAGAYIRSGVIRGGIASLQLNYQQAFATSVDCDIYINEYWIGSLTSGDGSVQVWAIEDIDIEGRIVMGFSNKTAGGQITLDDIQWTGFADGSPTGTRPAVAAIPPQTATVGEMFELMVPAVEPDGDPMTFSCLSDEDPATWTLDAATGEFRFTPVEEQIGQAEFVFRAADKDGTSLPVRMEVTVQSPLGTPLVYFDGPSRVYAEEGGPSVILPVRLSFPADATVRVAVAGTALSGGVDFSRSVTNLIFSNAGPDTLNLELTIVDDDLPEGPESARIRLNPTAGAMADPARQDTILFIRDNDAFSIVAANLTSGSLPQYEGPGERILQALCPDITLIQEFNLPTGSSSNDYRIWVDEQFGPDFHFYVEPEWSAQPLPNGIVSRWPILDCGQWVDTHVSNRDFAWATIDLPGPRNLHVVSVHLFTVSAEARESQARLLTNYIAQAGWDENDYLVVGGDLNVESRGEMALQVLSQIVSDLRQPTDQNGNKHTNSGRNNPYDLVLPSALLDARHRAISMWGHDFPDGLVFDTRPGYVKWELGIPPPALETDSAASFMQHMAVVKVFDLETILDPPSGFDAMALDASRVDVSWTPNAAGDDVIVAWNTDGVFLPPSGDPPHTGEAFAGGIVLHAGEGTNVLHEEVDACGTYHYRAWSVLGTNYSLGLSAFVQMPGPNAPAAVWTASTNATGFTAAWSAVPGIADYRLDVSTSPTFQDALGVRQTVFRETMGTVASNTAIDTHQANGGFDNPELTMDDGDAANPAEVRSTQPSVGYIDPAGHAASEDANIWFASTDDRGFGISGIDTTEYDALWLNFGYRKDSLTQNTQFDLGWSTNNGGTWNPIAVSSLPPEDAAAGWYMVSNLTVSAEAAGAANLRLRWVKVGSVAGRIDDVLLQGTVPPTDYLPGYSNRLVSGTSQTVTGLVEGITYYYRVRSMQGDCLGPFSPTGHVTTATSAGAGMGIAEWTGASEGPGFHATMTALPDTPGLRFLVYGASDFDEELRGFVFELLEEDVDFVVEEQTITIVPDAEKPWQIYRIGASPP